MTSYTDCSSGSVPINLGVVNERMRRLVYDRVRYVFFDAPDNVRTYGPDEAQLAVHFFAGRWFAVWVDLDAPHTLPEDARRQIVRITAASKPDGGANGSGLEFGEV